MIYRAHRRRDSPHADGRLGFIFSRVASGESRSMAASCRCYWHCLTRYAEQGLCNCWASVRPSVCLSVCPICRPHAATATLLPWPGRREISIDCCTAHSSATLSACVVAEHWRPVLALLLLLLVIAISWLWQLIIQQQFYLNLRSL